MRPSIVEAEDFPERPDISPPEAPDEVEAPEVLVGRKASQEAPYRPGESETVEWVEALRDEAGKAKKQQCDPESWASDISTWWGDWPGPGTLPSWKPKVSVNEIQSLGLQELSDLTDSRLQVYVQKDRSKTDRDDAVEQTIHTFWQRKFCDLAVMSAALDALVFPLGFLQSGWNPSAEQGQGEAVFGHRDPATVFPDGDAEDDDALRYVVLEDVLDLAQIRRDYPETGWAVRPEDVYSVKLGDQQTQKGRSGSGYLGPLYARSPMGGVPGYQKARARVLTCVVDDDALRSEMEHLPGLNGQPGRVKERLVARYPNKRLILVANRRVLYDDDNAYKYAPLLTRVALQPTLHGYWPRKSIVNAYAENQATANKADSLSAENMLRINIGQMFADADCGINPKNYAPIPGLFTLVKPGSRVWDVKGTPMPPEMVRFGEQIRGYIRANFGYPMSRTGAGTHGNVAAELAETEISQSMGLTRLRGRLLYQAVQKAVEMLFARMAQFYTTPRHLPYISEGELRAVKWEPIADPLTYAVHVDPASFQVRSKTMIQRLALTLARMGKFPDSRLFKILEIPDADRIAAELKEQMILAAAARMRQGRSRK